MQKQKGKVKKMTLEKLAQMTEQGFAAVDKRLDSVDVRLTILEVDMREVKERITRIEETMSRLVETLDVFVKRLDDNEQEFAIVKDEVRAMKKVLKDKLDADIDVLRHK